MKTVLIADDSSFMRKMIRAALEKEGLQVVAEADNGNDCVRKYAAYRPDLITLDVTMPGMNGLNTLKEIIRMNPDAKVMMISALGQEAIIRDAITAGAKAFIVKPFKFSHIHSAVSKLLWHQTLKG